MDELGKAAMQLNSVLKPMVAMIVKEIHPGNDELSMNAAYKTYGRTWIEEQRSRGNLQVRYKGNRKLLSVADIECLVAAEKETPRPIFKSFKR